MWPVTPKVAGSSPVAPASFLDAALMGRGAHIFLIDDSFGSMADARSEPARKNVHDWFSANSRLEKNGKLILINHRMHQDDLSGRLLAQQAAGGDQWTVVELKAVSPAGDCCGLRARRQAAMEAGFPGLDSQMRN
jgi:hypothetical protein